MNISLGTAGAGINQHVAKRVLIGIVQSYPEKFGIYANFEVTQSGVWSLYQRMKLSRRVATPQDQLLIAPWETKSGLSSFMKFHKKCYFTAFVMSWS